VALEKIKARLDALTSRTDQSGEAGPAEGPKLLEPRSPVDVTLLRPRSDSRQVMTVTQANSATFDRNVPRGLQIAASWSWRVLLIVAMVLALGWLLRYLAEVVIPVAVATLLAAMLFPVAKRLTSWGLPRPASAAISVFGGLILIFGALFLIGYQIASQAPALSSNVVNGFYALLAWLRDGPLPIDESWLRLDEWVTRIQEFLSTSQSTIAAWAQAIGTRVGHFLAGFAITLFALFYFLYDGRGIWSFLLRFFPSHVRDKVDLAALGGWRSLSAFVRATILVALVDAIGVLIVALILGVPLAPALAALVFIGAFVPLVGAFVSGFVAVAVALVALGWVQALIMLAGIIVVMQLEGHILQPFLLGRAVKLHPLAVLLGLAVGIIVGGIVGALLSIPILAFSKAFIQELRQLPGDEAVVMPESDARAG
jgi:putative heme transporter